MFRFLNSGSSTGAANMHHDETLALDLLEAKGDPALRMYTWSPWAISLGKHQLESGIDRERCLADGIDVVRRPTGGRAILHAEELTYCLVMPADGRSVLQVYNTIGLAILRGLRLFGVGASLEKSQPGFRTLYRTPSSVACFSSAARYEIVYEGRKLVGSAQRRYGSGDTTVVLQHGSILCGPAHLRLGEYLGRVDDAMRTEIAGDLGRRTASISEVTGNEVDTDHLARCIREGFEEEWGIRFQEYSTVSEHDTDHE